MARRPQYAFTAKFNKNVNQILSPVEICEPNNYESKKLQLQAIWDTGATCTVISENVVRNLKLSKLRETLIHTANGERVAGVYLIDLFLPGLCVGTIEVIDGAIFGDKDVLIGMDVIKKGDLAITYKYGKMYFSFCTPPTYHYDFTTKVKGSRNRKAMR